MKRADLIALAAKEVTFAYFIAMLNPDRRSPYFRFADARNVESVMPSLYQRFKCKLSQSEKDTAYHIASEHWLQCIEWAGGDSWLEHVEKKSQ